MAFSFNLTRESLRTLVLYKLGALAAGATPTTADSDLVIQAIDLRLKEAHRLGIVWRKVDSTPLSFTITANVASASASVDVLFPIAMHIVDGSTDAPVRIIGPVQYAGIENKSEGGTPRRVIWEGGAKFKFWPVPTGNTTAKLTYEKYEDDTSASATLDMDVAMLRSFRDMICYDCGDVFGKPEQTMVRWKIESDQAERNIRKLNAPRVDYATVAVDEYESVPGDYA